MGVSTTNRWPGAPRVALTLALFGGAACFVDTNPVPGNTSASSGSTSANGSTGDASTTHAAGTSSTSSEGGTSSAGTSTTTGGGPGTTTATSGGSSSTGAPVTCDAAPISGLMAAIAFPADAGALFVQLTNTDETCDSATLPDGCQSDKQWEFDVEIPAAMLKPGVYDLSTFYVSEVFTEASPDCSPGFGTGSYQGMLTITEVTANHISACLETTDTDGYDPSGSFQAMICP